MVARRTVLAALAASPLLCASDLQGDGTRPISFDPDGITAESKRSIKKGNDWLEKTFNRDSGCGIDIGTPSDISCTAMVGLAMMSQGTSPREGELYRLVRKTREYLIEASSKKKYTVNLRTQVKADLSGYADHHFGALHLSQSLGQGIVEASVSSTLKTLIKQISGGQTRQGHWGSGRYPMLGAVCGWVSLRGAYGAGLNVQASSDLTARLLYKSIQKKSGNLFPLSAGIRVLYALGRAEDATAEWALQTAIKQAKRLAFHRMGGEHFLALHFINEVMLQRGGDYWNRWYPMVRDKLIKAQNADGSWIGHSCITSRTFCTACAELVLSSPNRYLPISEF